MTRNYLYFIGQFVAQVDKPTHVKIGVSDNPLERIKQLQTGNPYNLKFFAVLPIDPQENREVFESEHHKLFEKDRVNGEWFLFSEDIEKWIHRNVLSGSNVKLDFGKNEEQFAKSTLLMTSSEYYKMLGSVQEHQDQLNRNREKFELFRKQQKCEHPRSSLHFDISVSDWIICDLCSHTWLGEKLDEQYFNPTNIPYKHMREKMGVE